MTHANLWAPWRMAYLRELNRRAVETRGDGEPAREQIDQSEMRGSFLHDYWSDSGRDEENLVIHRNDHGIILLNRYPYANGHLMVALGEPRASLMDYRPQQRAEFWKLVERGMGLMQRALNPQGVNLGINEGAAAGAGLPEHVHAHLVPRWHGDTNFMAVVGDVRVIPDALQAMWQRYHEVAD